MATAVLSPQDCLRDPSINRGGLLSTPPRTKVRRNPNPTTTSTSTPSSTATKHGRGQSNNRRKRSPNSSPPPRPTPDSSLSPQSSAVSKLVMGQVKILKRGDEIQTVKKNVSPVAAAAVNVRNVEVKLDLAVSLPETPKKPTIKVVGAPLLNKSVAGFYAGSGFFTSPPPSSLPVPVFLKKSGVGAVVNNDATNDLRRLLNLAL